MGLLQSFGTGTSTTPVILNYWLRPSGAEFTDYVVHFYGHDTDTDKAVHNCPASRTIMHVGLVESWLQLPVAWMCRVERLRDVLIVWSVAGPGLSRVDRVRLSGQWASKRNSP